MSAAELESLIGLLVFCTRGFLPGSFFRRGLNELKLRFLAVVAAKKSVSKNTKLGPLSAKAEQEVLFWLSALDTGASTRSAFFQPPRPCLLSAEVIVFVDWSEREQAFGVSVPSHGLWAIIDAPIRYQEAAMGTLKHSSVIMEGFAALEALVLLRDVVRGRQVALFSDSEGFLKRFAALGSDSNVVVDSIIKHVAWLMFTDDFACLMYFVCSSNNLSDSLSRRDMQRFREQHAELNFSMNTSPLKTSSSTIPIWPKWPLTTLAPA